jgi:signal peptidase I
MAAWFRLAVVGALATAALASACSSSDVVRRVRWEGPSMEPTLVDGTMVEALDYRGASAQRGDVILFASLFDPHRMFIKRVIGLPGDKIEITGAGDVMVNGEVLSEPYAQGATTCSSIVELERTYLAAGDTGCHLTVPEGTYYLLGDNRPRTSDSRHGWVLPEENIIGWVDVGEG